MPGREESKGAQLTRDAEEIATKIKVRGLIRFFPVTWRRGPVRNGQSAVKIEAVAQIVVFRGLLFGRGACIAIYHH